MCRVGLRMWENPSRQLHRFQSIFASKKNVGERMKQNGCTPLGECTSRRHRNRHHLRFPNVHGVAETVMSRMTAVRTSIQAQHYGTAAGAYASLQQGLLLTPLVIEYCGNADVKPPADVVVAVVMYQIL